MKKIIPKIILGAGLVGGAVVVKNFSAREGKVAAENVAVVAAAPTPSEQVGTVVPEFNFLSQDELRFVSSSLHDKVWIANFIFTSCESMCPLIAKKMQGIQERFLKEESFQLLSFSLDPANDTPLKLKAYAQKYQADLSRWQFLTGNWREIKALMQDGFKVAAPDQPASHTDRLVLVDKGMRIHGYYSANAAEDVERLSRDIGMLVSK